MAPKPRKPKGKAPLPRYGTKILPGEVLEEIPGSGGIKKVVADRLGVSYSGLCASLQKEGRDWDRVRQALKDEVEIVADEAEDTIREMIGQREDLRVAANTSKWLLERLRVKKYTAPRQVTVSGGDKPVEVTQQNVISIADLNLPLTVKKAILRAIDEAAGVDDE